MPTLQFKVLPFSHYGGREGGRARDRHLTPRARMWPDPPPAKGDFSLISQPINPGPVITQVENVLC